MAAKKKRVINLDRLRSTEKVRCGRANLTVERMPSVHLAPVADCLRAHREGRANEEDVAWAFIREQVTGHTPSFDWATADLTRLLPRITAVTREPKIKAKTPAELVPELEEIEKKERESWRRLNERIQKAMRPSQDLQKLTTARMPTRSLDALKTAAQASELTHRSVTFNYDKTLEAMQPQMKALESSRINWARITKLVLAQSPPLQLKIDPAIWTLHGLQPGFDEHWRKLAEQLAEAAREADSPDIAEAVEATASEAAADPAQPDLTPLWERLDELSEQIKGLAPGDSTTRAILIAVAASLIIRVIEYWLATKYGIQMPAPPEGR